ncbi:lipid IV(A) 3-deoxy-D-manno-octulosonic acid transferase [Vibrio breoganii]|uniref:lipid IV(A) 3-deoxy-D-manno-octulosonic acid transferase n=1 Tax=Vibrio breoganii TaxID=553239 RepID=UPI000C859A2E|nr:lipid IV(A) 3-deoxy-D-manno-octulosonic acid transferase [Vibrio breoganii]PMK30902.1 3-deoxy-D-manno-octulosonic acid transferase [Vibrio breoganii]PML14580.1 3-deoxy-D-manno-octulosonic acid transferase [Vibrio breoganii]PML79863.1 3-deoxy-D-manno-octulosonic acid transferase [Vibrio breoganii]PMM51648.1 3-deoxy-D-manno-octulosonic acid transferase [Vibrio breoganii]PMO97436.1 3-deoxy-D-manno-octulosonic acid transferase [Vibrio breoganii]
MSHLKKLKSTLLKLVYTSLLFLVSPLLLSKLLLPNKGKPAIGKRWYEYFGILPSLKGNSPIWIHTVSVGETIAASPLIRAIKDKYPQQDILITTTTTTGAEQASKLSDIAEHRYMPVDFSWCIKRFLKVTKPKCMLIMETELWPNTLTAVSNAEIPIAVINARLSERSCLRYQKFQSVFNLIAKSLDKVLCQHDDDAERFRRLGLLSSKTAVTGSLKFDISISETVQTEGKTLRKQLGANRPVWIAASTHEGEDETIYKAHQQLLKVIPEALLLIVPRHPERFSTVAKLGKESGLNVVSRTDKSEVTTDVQVYLGDTMGEMLTLISASDICFMAGSLIGDKVGGHNMLEPAALGKPILNGPSFFNFKDITQQLVDEKALTICESDNEISKSLIRLFKDPSSCKEMGRNAYRVVERNQGAVAKTVDALESIVSAK